MVILLPTALVAFCLLAASPEIAFAASEPGAQQVAEPDRRPAPDSQQERKVAKARLTMALTGLILLGATLVAITAIAGRYLRRQARRRLPPASLDEKWYAKPLVTEAKPPSDEVL